MKIQEVEITLTDEDTGESKDFTRQLAVIERTKVDRPKIPSHLPTWIKNHRPDWIPGPAKTKGRWGPPICEDEEEDEHEEQKRIDKVKELAPGIIYEEEFDKLEAIPFKDPNAKMGEKTRAEFLQEWKDYLFGGFFM